MLDDGQLVTSFTLYQSIPGCSCLSAEEGSVEEIVEVSRRRVVWGQACREGERTLFVLYSEGDLEVASGRRREGEKNVDELA